MLVTTSILAMRIAVGVFFAISGFHKLTNKTRHEALRATLIKDKVPFIRFNEWFVPTCEFLSGMAVAVGLLTFYNALVLLIICAVACLVDAPARVREYQPINRLDEIDDWLYLPEVCYLFMLLVVAAQAY